MNLKERPKKIMVKLSKSKLPDGWRIKKPADYQGGKIFKLICEDCYNKCYICEEKTSSINVEHLLTHKNDEDLKYNWNNLFYSCYYCNQIKNRSKFYDSIIDPKKIDPEEYLEISMPDHNLFKDIHIVIIKKIKDDDIIDSTRELLELVYNSDDSLRDNKKAGADNLRVRVAKDIALFWYTVNDYYRDKNNEEIKKFLFEEISRKGQFAAFKRYIVRNDPRLSIDFADALKA